MDAGQRVMTSTHLETRGLFEEVAGAMRSHGYRRTSEQVRAKLKRVKAEFFDSLEDWRGIPPRAFRPASFRLLRELWEQGGRPGWQLRTPNRPPRAPRRLPTSEDQRGEARMEQEPGEAAGPHDPVVVVSSPADSESDYAQSSGGEQEESTREEASCEEEIPAPHEEEVVLVREEHPRVDISSGTEGEAVKRQNYRLGFLERPLKRMRQIMQRSQTRARQRRRQEPQTAHQPSGPLAIMEEGGQAGQEGPPTGPTV
ncbi:UNVERIFIED_CONTAM: hypothetical protein K2H54_005114 [Gekko kuhli]